MPEIFAESLIAAPASDVWSAIAAPGNLEACHPFCAKNPVTTWPGANSVDEVHYLNGVVYERRFKAWFDGEGYDLEIHSRGRKIASVEWRVSRVDGHNSRLRITVFPHALDNRSAVVRWFAYRFVVRPRLRQYLESVTGGFEWFVEKAEPVPRNHFGTHPWFSRVVSR